MTQLKNIVFICVENSARSQMAEGFLKSMAPQHIKAQSAGTKPSTSVNSKAIKVMQEIGIDITNQRPKSIKSNAIMQEITNDENNNTIMINMGCIDAKSCPVQLTNHDMINWNVEDPKDKSIQQIREIRDTIKHRVKDIINELEKRQQSC